MRSSSSVSAYHAKNLPSSFAQMVSHRFPYSFGSLESSSSVVSTAGAESMLERMFLYASKRHSHNGVSGHLDSSDNLSISEFTIPLSAFASMRRGLVSVCILFLQMNKQVQNSSSTFSGFHMDE